MRYSSWIVAAKADAFARNFWSDWVGPNGDGSTGELSWQHIYRVAADHADRFDGPARNRFATLVANWA